MTPSSTAIEEHSYLLFLTHVEQVLDIKKWYHSDLHVMLFIRTITKITTFTHINSKNEDWEFYKYGTLGNSDNICIMSRLWCDQLKSILVGKIFGLVRLPHPVSEYLGPSFSQILDDMRRPQVMSPRFNLLPPAWKKEYTESLACNLTCVHIWASLSFR